MRKKSDMKIKVGLVQISTNEESTALTLIKKALSSKCEIIALPEMWLTGFIPTEEKINASKDFIKKVMELSKNHDALIIPGSFPVKEGPHIYNTAFAIHKGEIIHIRKKFYLFSPMGETKYFSTGSYPETFEFKGLRIAIVICYELRFPDIFLNLMLKNTPDIVLVIAQWPSKRRYHWITLLQGRAIEGQYFVAGVNVTKPTGKLSFTGDSRTFSPLGNPLLEAGEEEGVFVCELDIKEILNYRRSIPVLEDIKRAQRDGDF